MQARGRSRLGKSAPPRSLSVVNSGQPELSPSETAKTEEKRDVSERERVNLGHFGLGPRSQPGLARAGSSEREGGEESGPRKSRWAAQTGRRREWAREERVGHVVRLGQLGRRETERSGPEKRFCFSFSNKGIVLDFVYLFVSHLELQK
jgi:hypothetical protein